MPWRCSRWRHAPQQEADVLDEAEIEHAIGFVDHDDFDGAEREHVLLEVVEQAAGRGDDDVAAGAQRVALLVVVDAAVDQRRGEPGVAAEAAEILVDLDRQLARRREDERARIGRLAIGDGRLRQQAIQDRDQECGGLAGAGLRLSGDVAARPARTASVSAWIGVQRTKPAACRPESTLGCRSKLSKTISVSGWDMNE